jgi:hypothetical protein
MDRIVELDVGGRAFKTFRSTLTSGSDFFRARFSDVWDVEPQKPIFVDRDPVGFAHVLNLLRDPNYSFPHETYGHELEFFGIRVPVVPVDDEEDDLQVRNHETVPEQSSTLRRAFKTAQSVHTFSLMGLIARGITNLKPEHNELGPRMSIDHPFVRFSKRAIFQKTCHTRVSIESLKTEETHLTAFALHPSQFADAWDDPRLILRFRSEEPLPRTRVEFFRRGFLSALLKQVDLLAMPVQLVDNCVVQPQTLDRTKLRLLANLNVETLEALELVREEQVGERASLFDRVFAESPGELSVSLDCIFKLCDGASEECDAIPDCKDFLCAVAFVVKHRLIDGFPVELVDVRMTANCYLFDNDVRPRPADVARGQLTVDLWCPGCQKHCKPGILPPPNQLAFLDWRQESFAVDPGKSEFAVELDRDGWGGVLHEIMFFVRQEADDGPDKVLAGKQTLVRVRKMELCLNHQMWVPWSERELVEAMAEHDWKPASPIYKLHYGAQGTDLRRFDTFRLRVTLWRPALRASKLHVCIKSQLRMRRFKEAEWPDSLQSVTIV